MIGQTFADVLERFAEDPETKAVVLIGEVGGNLEAEGARNTDVPLVAYIAGVSAPPDKRMGHAGAIVEGGRAMPNPRLQNSRRWAFPSLPAPLKFRIL